MHIISNWEERPAGASPDPVATEFAGKDQIVQESKLRKNERKKVKQVTVIVYCKWAVV